MKNFSSSISKTASASTLIARVGPIGIAGNPTNRAGRIAVGWNIFYQRESASNMRVRLRVQRIPAQSWAGVRPVCDAVRCSIGVGIDRISPPETLHR